MIHLNLNIGTLTLAENNFFVCNVKKTPKNKDLNKTSLYLESFNASSSYKDFIKVLKAEANRHNTSMYIFYCEGDTLYVFRGNSYNAKQKLIFKYIPENAEMLEYIKKILNINETKNYAYVASNLEVKFSVIAPWQILDVLLTRKFIESNGEVAFKTFKHKSKNGKIRDITAPHDSIKSSLQELNSLLQRVYDGRNEGIQVAYKKGKSVLDGAGVHRNDKYVFNLDIHDFYPSCKKELVRKYTDFLFKYCFNRNFIEEEFLNTITINDGLFIGSPISGTLANAIISNPVSYMVNICKKYNMHVSVYADDISFSSNKRISKDFVTKIFNDAFAKYQLDSYFLINEKKSIGFTGCNRKVTGVSINDSNKLTVPGRYFLTLKSKILHYVYNIEPVDDVNVLRGKIAYATMVDESGKVYRYLCKYRDAVEKLNLCSAEKMAELDKKFGNNVNSKGGNNGTE